MSKDKFIKVRVTEKEAAEFREWAALHGVSLSVLLRALLQQRRLIPAIMFPAKKVKLRNPKARAVSAYKDISLDLAEQEYQEWTDAQSYDTRRI